MGIKNIYSLRHAEYWSPVMPLIRLESCHRFFYAIEPFIIITTATATRRATIDDIVATGDIGGAAATGRIESHDELTQAATRDATGIYHAI